MLLRGGRARPAAWGPGAALTPSRGTVRWHVGCQGSATPTPSAWTRPGCPLQSGWFPCLSSTLSGRRHPPRARLWSAALQEVSRAHWLLPLDRRLSPQPCRQTGGPKAAARPTCGDEVLLLRAIQTGTADPAQRAVGPVHPPWKRRAWLSPDLIPPRLQRGTHR